MTRVLAHEMMSSLTPIASLSASLDALLRRGGPTEEVSGALESITRRSHGLMRFVERYRQVADLPPPRLQSLRLTTLLEGVERLIRPAFAERGIAFTSRVTPSQLSIAGDPDLLEQALINLLRNAGDAASGQPQPVVEIACGIDGDRCFIDICDNGPGLSELAREQIFVPFFTTKPGGSGVGLSLARRIAASHGGQLTLQSGKRGAVFRLALPLIVRPAQPAKAEAAGNGA
jgi:signal transduction histidine kinase